MCQCISGSQSIFEHFDRGREFQHFMGLHSYSKGGTKQLTLI